MDDEQESSQLQHFNHQQTYIRRQNHNENSNNLMKFAQTSVLNVKMYIQTQNEGENTFNRKQLQIQRELKLKCFAALVELAGKKLLFNKFLQWIKCWITSQENQHNLDPIHVDKVYQSISKTLLSQVMYFMLSILSVVKLPDLNKELSSKKLSLTIELKEQQNSSQVIFVSSLVSIQKEQDYSSTNNSKQKSQSHEVKMHQKQESNSIIEPLQSQTKDKTAFQEIALMNYLKQYSLDTNFIILFSIKQQFYLLNKNSKLGEGGFGNVFKSELLKINKGQYLQSFWAIKQLKRGVTEYQSTIHRISQDRQHHMLTKIPLLSGMKKCPYKSIIQVEEVINFDDKKYIVYEFCAEKDLNKFMKMHDKLTKKHIFQIIYQLASTLASLHYKAVNNKQDLTLLNQIEQDQELLDDHLNYFSKAHQNQRIGIIHRDLKLSNILISHFSENNVKIKVIDWAFSKKILTEKAMCRTICGTPNYQAPQILNKKIYCCKVDVWALGVIIYELLAGRQFIQKEEKQKVKSDQSFTKNRIDKMQFKSNKNFTEQEIAYWKHLVTQCMQFKAQNRFTSLQAFEYLQQCPFFKPYDSESVKFIQNLKMMKALYYQHHQCLLMITPLTSISKKIIKNLDEVCQNIIQDIYQKFTQDKYWREQASQVSWHYVRIGFARQKSENTNKLALKNCLGLLQDRFFNFYSKRQKLEELLLSIRQIYQKVTASKQMVC